MTSLFMSNLRTQNKYNLNTTWVFKLVTADCAD